MKYVNRSLSGAAPGEYALEQSLGRHRQFRTREQLGSLFAQVSYGADAHPFGAVLVAGQPDVVLQRPPIPAKDLASIACHTNESFRNRTQQFAPECALSRRDPESLSERSPGTRQFSNRTGVASSGQCLVECDANFHIVADQVQVDVGPRQSANFLDFRFKVYRAGRPRS